MTFKSRVWHLISSGWFLVWAIFSIVLFWIGSYLAWVAGLGAILTVWFTRQFSGRNRQAEYVIAQLQMVVVFATFMLAAPPAPDEPERITYYKLLDEQILTGISRGVDSLFVNADRHWAEVRTHHKTSFTAEVIQECLNGREGPIGVSTAVIYGFLRHIHAGNNPYLDQLVPVKVGGGDDIWMQTRLEISGAPSCDNCKILSAKTSGATKFQTDLIRLVESELLMTASPHYPKGSSISVEFSDERRANIKISGPFASFSARIYIEGPGQDRSGKKWGKTIILRTSFRKNRLLAYLKSREGLRVESWGNSLIKHFAHAFPSAEVLR